MGVSKTKAQEFLTALEEAYAAIITGKSFTLSFGGNTRNLTRQDIDTVREEMMFWSSYISKIENGNRGLDMKFGTSYDNY